MIEQPIEGYFQFKWSVMVFSSGVDIVILCWNKVHFPNAKSGDSLRPLCDMIAEHCGGGGGLGVRVQCYPKINVFQIPASSIYYHSFHNNNIQYKLQL